MQILLPRLQLYTKNHENMMLPNKETAQLSRQSSI